MERKRKSPKGRIDGPTSVIRVHSVDGTIMLNVVKEVSKTVVHPNPPDPKKPNVKRKCTLTFPAVEVSNEDWIEDALVICGGDSNLAARIFNYGLYRWIGQQVTNELGKVGEASKNLAKAIAAFTGLGLSAEQARAMVMASPEAASKIQNETFEQYITRTIDDFQAFASEVDEKGNKSLRFPDITKAGADDETAEGEAEEK